MPYPLALCLAALALCLLAAASADGSSNPQTAAEVWAGYDPRALPLDLDLKREWVEDGVQYRKFFFTAEVWEGEPARILAYTGAPLEAKGLPAVLHIHGGGQTASLDWVRFWTRRGYAAGTFDYCGAWENREEHSLWGKVEADMATSQRRRVTQPSVRHSPWYHWTLAARRMLTVLERMPETDPDRMGILGISIGGTVAWMVAGADPRVKCAVPVYGNGWLLEQPWGRKRDPEPDDSLWQRTMEPQAYAPQIACPVLYMSATNDFYGWMESGYRTLALVEGPTRQIYTPHFNHHIQPEDARSLPLWMDAHLRGGPAFPETPSLELTLADAIPRALVSLDRPDEVADLRIYYCLGERAPQGRYWRRAAAARVGDTWHADLPVPDVTLPLRCFANVYYRSGVALSTNMPQAVPAQMGQARATEKPSLLIDDFAQGFEGWYFGPAFPDPRETWTYLRWGEGPEGAKGLTVNPEPWKDRPIAFEFVTHKVGDPQWRGPAGAALSFWFRGGEPTRLVVKVEEKTWAVGRTFYEAPVELQDAARWQRIVLPVGAFATEEGAPLGGWDEVDRLAFAGETPPGSPPVLARVEWVPGPEQ